MRRSLSPGQMDPRCEPGEEGELVHRGPLVALGYWGDPVRTAERFKPAPGGQPDWRTPELAVWSGDTVVADEEGYLYFVGRRDEMIKTSGYRVSPTEVEEVAYDSGLVRDAVALGVEDARLGQRIVLLTTAAGEELDPKELIAHMRRKLPLYMVPASVEVRSELPRSPNGKFDRSLLKSELAMALAPNDRSPSPQSMASSLLAGYRYGGWPTRVGSTPFFAYDRGLLDQRVDQLRDALPPAVKLSYAMKANPDARRSCSILPRRVDAIDVASALEMRRRPGYAVATGADQFCGSREDGGRDPAGRRRGRHDRARIRDSKTRRVIEAGEPWARRPRVAVRVNPDFKVKGSGMRMGGGPQQFGVDAEQVPQLLMVTWRQRTSTFSDSTSLPAPRTCKPTSCVRRSAGRSTWSWSLRSTARSQCAMSTWAAASAFRTSIRISRSIWRPLATIWRSWLMAAWLASCPKRARSSNSAATSSVNAGSTSPEMIDRKISRGQTYLVVDGGLHHQLAASGNFGQVIRRNYPIAVGTRMDEAADAHLHCRRLPVHAAGSAGRSGPAAGRSAGDLIVIFQAGAYGLTASPTAFLGHPAPAEVLV